MPSTLPLYFPLPFLNVWLRWCRNSGSTVLSGQPTIYTWHRFSFSLPVHAWKSMPGHGGQEGTGPAAGAPCGSWGMLPPLPSTAGVRDILMLLVELPLLLVFRTPDRFHDKMLGYIYLSCHQMWSLKFLSGKHLSCAVNELGDLGTSLTLGRFLCKRRGESHKPTPFPDSNIKCSVRSHEPAVWEISLNRLAAGSGIYLLEGARGCTPPPVKSTACRMPTFPLPLMRSSPNPQL